MISAADASAKRHLVAPPVRPLAPPYAAPSVILSLLGVSVLYD